MINELNRAYALGWLACSEWANRNDLVADIGSPAYVADREAMLKDLVKLERIALVQKASTGSGFPEGGFTRVIWYHSVENLPEGYLYLLTTQEKK